MRKRRRRDTDQQQSDEEDQRRARTNRGLPAESRTDTGNRHHRAREERVTAGNVKDDPIHD